MIGKPLRILRAGLALPAPAPIRLHGGDRMTLHHDRRTFLKLAIGAAGAGVALPLLSACSAPASTTAPAQTAPAVNTQITKVSYAYASANGLHYVATVGSEKPDLPHKFGIEF